MAQFGCYRMLLDSPDRTWVADYIAHKNGQVEFWQRGETASDRDILIAVALLERGQTIAEVTSTKMVGPTIYQAALQDDTVYPLYP